MPAAGSRGTRRWAAARSLPSRTEFDGQVVARWVLNDTDPDKISGGEDTPQPCLAIDDGIRTWSFGADWQEFRRVSIGDLVRVQTKPRTSELLTLTRVTTAGSQPAPSPVPHAPGWAIRRIPPPSQDHSPVPAGPVIGEASPEPAAGLTETVVLPAGLPLSEAEVSAALGQPVRVYRTGMPGWQGFIYRGASRTLSVTVTGSGWARSASARAAAAAGPSRYRRGSLAAQPRPHRGVPPRPGLRQGNAQRPQRTQAGRPPGRHHRHPPCG